MKLNNLKLIFLITLLFICQLFLTISIHAEKTPDIWVNNHVMAHKINRYDDGYRVIDFPLRVLKAKNSTNAFETFDSFVCNPGTYSVVIKIIQIENGEIVASSNPFTITSSESGYPYHEHIESWNYSVPNAGLYEYQIWANGSKFGSFVFTQRPE